MELKRSFDHVDSNGNGFQADPLKLSSMQPELDELQYDCSSHSKEDKRGGPQEAFGLLRTHPPQIERSFRKHHQGQNRRISLSNLKSVDTPLNFLSLGPGDQGHPSFGPFQEKFPGKEVCVQPHTDNKIRPGLSEGKHEPSAQLTIFYSGVVNVYDNIPADDAYSIMLLARTASSLRPKSMNLPSGENMLPIPFVGLKTATAVLSDSERNAGENAPAAYPSRLPLARKASLARFLEERKDRIMRHKRTADDIAIDECSQTADVNPSRLKEKSPNLKKLCSKAGLNPGRDEESTASAESG